MSGTPLKNGKSMRAQRQVNKWNNEEEAVKYDYRITHTEQEGPGARVRILDYERSRALKLKEEGHLLHSYYHQRP